MQFRSAVFVSAVVFTLAALAFTFDESGVQWAWAEMPQVALALGLVGAGFWVAFVRRALHRERAAAS